MQQMIILSLRPKYWEAMINGMKDIEIRKNRPDIHGEFIAHVYETKNDDGQGKIVGIIKFGKIIKFNDIKGLQNSGKTFLTNEELAAYKGSSPFLYSWKVKSIEVFENPYPIQKYGLIKPPQSWQYFFGNLTEQLDFINHCSRKDTLNLSDRKHLEEIVLNLKNYINHNRKEIN